MKRTTLTGLFGVIIIAVIMAVFREHQVVRQQMVIAQESQRKLMEAQKQATEARRAQSEARSLRVREAIAGTLRPTLVFPQDGETLTLYPNSLGVPPSGGFIPIPNATPEMAWAVPIPPSTPGLATAIPIPLAPVPEYVFDVENPSLARPWLDNSGRGNQGVFNSDPNSISK